MKTSARTRGQSKPIILASGRSVTDPTKKEPESIRGASGRSSNGSHPTTRTAEPSLSPSGGSSNGAQPTTRSPEPSSAPSAAPSFNLHASLREFLAQNPHLTTRDELVNSYITQLSESEARTALRIALRRFTYELIGRERRDSWIKASRRTTSTPNEARNQEHRANVSPKWQAIKESVVDGSLDSYRLIVDAQIVVNENRVRFGDMTLTQIEVLIDLRSRQERSLAVQRKRFTRVHEQMRVTGAMTVGDLDAEWLVKEWEDA